MFIKSFIFLLLSPMLLLLKEGGSGKLVIVIYREPEFMYGNIKQVIELRPDFHTEPQLCSDDTTGFDKTGNSVETRMGIGIKGGLCVKSKYIYKYDGKGIKIETTIIPENDTDGKKVYKFDNEGRVIESGVLTESNKLYNRTTGYQYNFNGNILSAIHYVGHGRIGLIDKYKYDHRNHLIEDDLYNGTKIIERSRYRYILFDKNGNWISRMEIHDNGEKFTIHRKITYY